MKKLINFATSAILGQVSDFFKRRRIELAVERSILAVVEPLSAFLEMERITREQQRLLVAAAELELRPFVLEPSRLFTGSLDGDVMYRQIRQEHPFPEEIRDERLDAVYELLVPRMANVLCKLLPVLEEWKTEAWHENFRRLDEMSEILRRVLGRLDAEATQTAQDADALLARLRRGATQREIFRMDLTALRSDAVIGCGFDALFIQPAFTEHDKKNPRHINSASDIFSTFAGPHTRTIIIGAAGAGKSTWLRWVERTGNEAAWSGLIIRVELRATLRETDFPSYLELLKTAAGLHLADEIDSDEAKDWRNRGRLAFLVDGFDEVPADQRDSVYEWIVGLSNAIGVCPLLLTSRTLTTNHLSRFDSSWTTWTIDPFDGHRIIDYIERWYKYAELPAGVDRGVEASDLATSWVNDSTIKPLTGNPLLLATLLLVHVLDGNLPSGRARLYQRYVEGMLGLWDDRQKRLPPKVALTPSQKRDILRGLAVQMFLAQVDQIEEHAAVSAIDVILSKLGVTADGNEVLDVLRERTGLLIGPGIYSFSHKTVAEFLVAEAIVDGTIRDDSGDRLDRMRLFRHRNDDAWTVVCFLWAGLAPTVEFERFILDLIEGDHVGEEAWSLAFGLLNDQFERVSSELWNRCLELFSHFDVKPQNEHRFGADCFSFDIRAPTVILRAIGPAEGMVHLLGRAQSRGYMTCLRDGRDYQKNMALRWHMATNDPFDETWCDSLQPHERTPTAEKTKWTIIASIWSFHGIFLGEATDGPAAISTFKDRYPQLVSTVTFYALWVLATNNTEATEPLNFDPHTMIHFLANCDNHSISDEQITQMDSEFSRINMIRRGHETTDIRQSLPVLRFAIKLGPIPSDEAADNAITFVTSFLDRGEILRKVAKST